MTVLFIVAIIILFLSIDAVHRRIRKPVTISSAAGGHHPTPYALRTPEGIFFARSHTWLNLFPSGKVRLGIDDLVSGLLDRPEVIFLKRGGEDVRKGDPLFVLREGDRRLTIGSPLDGRIISANDTLADHAETLKTAPFSDGWVYSVKPNRLSDVKQLLLGSESRSWMQNELSRLRDFFAAALEIDGRGSLAGAMLQDGGLPSSDAMKSLDEQMLHRFQEEFLTVAES
jgi:glycine cleavage system H protein